MNYFTETTDPKLYRCGCGRPECEAPKQPHRLLLMYLNITRELYGKPIVVTSGNRCAWYNAQQGGADPSEHVRPGGCLGADLHCTSSRDRAKLLDACRLAGLTRIGIYPAHLHVGVGDTIDPQTFPGVVTWVGTYKGDAAA